MLLRQAGPYGNFFLTLLWSDHKQIFFKWTLAPQGPVVFLLGCLKLLDFAEVLVLSPIEWFLGHGDTIPGRPAQCHIDTSDGSPDTQTLTVSLLLTMILFK